MRRERQKYAVLNQELFIMSEAVFISVADSLPHLKYKARLPAGLGRRESTV